MARKTESDATYCSDIEKEERNLIRRSKRLSQRNLFSSFRSKRDPLQRLYEIYQNLENGHITSKWSIDDWQSLKIEVESIQQILKGRQKGRLSFVLKKINKNLEKSSPKVSSVPVSIELNQNVEQEKSPNILAGMMSENLTEVPPYQPQTFCESVNAESIIVITQKNPLDLTKKNVENQIVSHEVLTQESTLKQQEQQPTNSKTPARAVPLKKLPTPKSTTLSIPNDTMIDLTEENAIEKNRENISPAVKEKSPIHVNKWFKFLPTQQRPKIPEKLSRLTPATVINTTSVPERNSKSLKDSIKKLYRDLPSASKSRSEPIIKSSTAGCSKKSINIHKQKPPPITTQLNKKCQKPLRNTDTMIPRERDLLQLTPRNSQTQNIHIIPSDDEFLDLNVIEMNDSWTSLTPSLKEGFRNVFGTDKLSDVFGDGDEVIYELKEVHISRLANALKIEHSVLKKTIDSILSVENYGLVFEDDERSDSSSVVECSQSPTPRLFPSQRSQT